ncbi:MAG: hypothetical protein JJE17_01700 [Peptostreptococcaceae bacterium]|nr:hypothetical protein [Peptostreptococcaceae bacterium]
MIEKSLSEIARELGIPEATAINWTRRIPTHFSTYEMRGSRKFFDYETTRDKLTLIRQQQHKGKKLDFYEVENLLDSAFTPIIEVELDRNNNTLSTQQQHNGIMVNSFTDPLITKALESIGKLSDFTHQVNNLEEENRKLKEELIKIKENEDNFTTTLDDLAQQLEELKAGKKKKGWFGRYK